MKRFKTGWSLGISFVTANLLVLAMQYASFKPFEDSWIDWIRDNMPLYALSTAILFILILGLDGLFDNTLFAAGIAAAAVGALTFGNYHKLMVLGEPVYPWDLNQLRQFSEILNIARDIASPRIVTAVLAGSVVLLTATFFLPRARKGMAYRFGCVFAAALMVFSCFHVQSTVFAKPLSKLGVVDHNWNQRENYLMNGFVIAFLQNIGAKIQSQPAGYSEEEINRILQKYTNPASPAGASEEQPNIVLVMNESLFDPTRLSGVSFSEDPLSRLHRNEQRFPSGKSLSPTYGGGTSNVEFEALTGLSMSFMNQGATPYQQLLVKTDRFPSMVSLLKDKGYQTTAIHPFDGTFYNRNRVYPVLGFDQFITQDNIAYTDTLTDNGFISDMAAARQVMDVLNAGEAPQFIHLVTMQNHLPIQGVAGADPLTVKGLQGSGKKELESYAQSIRESDRAIQYLIDSIQEVKRPTIVLVFGDHLPALEESTYIQGTEGLSEVERTQFQHETPLLLAANYPMKAQSLGTVSPSFFGPILFEQAGLQQPPFYQLLQAVKRELPGLTRSVYVDAGGQPLLELSDGQEELLRDYEMVQYDLLYGNKYALPMMK
jgi:hypothetical protein